MLATSIGNVFIFVVSTACVPADCFVSSAEFGPAVESVGLASLRPLTIAAY
eukprot:SAG31_NODE_40521_length_280_cov_0.850829_1_plen_50_part_10